MINRKAAEAFLQALDDEIAALELDELRNLMPRSEIDARALIRESRVYESTAGPPRGHPKNELPPLGKAGAKLKSGLTAAQTVDPENIRHLRDSHSEFSEMANRVPRLADPHDQSDVLFTSKIMDLWARGPCDLCRFLFEIACGQLRRTELEAALDRHLGSKSTCSGSVT